VGEAEEVERSREQDKSGQKQYESAFWSRVVEG
jgi:hypothetical protein